MNSKLQKGVTLVELMVVVAIIAILGSIGVYSFRSQIFKGNDAKRKSDIRRIAVAIEEYEKDNNCYPTADTVSCSPGTGLRPYLDKIPCDPETNSTYAYETDNQTCARWYRFSSELESSSEVFYYGSPNAPNVSQ